VEVLEDNEVNGTSRKPDDDGDVDMT
jgi:hypothetical protein